MDGIRYKGIPGTPVIIKGHLLTTGPGGEVLTCTRMADEQACEAIPPEVIEATKNFTMWWEQTVCPPGASSECAPEAAPSPDHVPEPQAAEQGAPETSTEEAPAPPHRPATAPHRPRRAPLKE